uniref:Uncharacterized protein n=1 Tax=Cucumis melo TaxID=3656 RepID=A0A9I9CKJ3_CUCME
MKKKGEEKKPDQTNQPFDCWTDRLCWKQQLKSIFQLPADLWSVWGGLVGKPASSGGRGRFSNQTAPNRPQVDTEVGRSVFQPRPPDAHL